MSKQNREQDKYSSRMEISSRIFTVICF